MEKLSNYLDQNEFISTRRYLRRVKDRNPFVSATILLLLDQLKEIPLDFAPHLAAIKTQLLNYQENHLTYHWLLQNGASRISNAPILGALPQLTLSPDADCSVLQIMALDQSERVNTLCQELEFYRVDNKNFRLAKYQQIAPQFENTFLTWFPPREESHSQKLESIDIAVNANILWFLGKYGKLSTAGAAETLNSILATLKTDLILEKPFYLSPYYPNPILILYKIARAADFGNLTPLKEAAANILSLREKCPEAKNSLEVLLHAATLCHLGKYEFAKNYMDRFSNFKKLSGAYYVIPFLSALALRLPLAAHLASLAITQMNFESDALQISLALWIREKIDLNS